LFDHAGNVFRHGMPDEDREWTLEPAGQKRSKGDGGKTVSVRMCPGPCYVVYPASAGRCPECGATPEPKPREVETVAGELVELAAIQADRARAEKRREIGMAKDRADLERIARERGYKPQWVNYILESRRKNNATRRIDPSAKISEWKNG
jgi:hypothetical protein